MTRGICVPLPRASWGVRYCLANPVGSPGLPVREPRISLGVLARVVRVEVDEDPLYQEVPDLEHVAPAARGPLGYAGAPGTVAVLPMAGALAHDHVAAREHPVEVRKVMDDLLDAAAHVREQLADLVLARRQAPLGEVDLRIVGEEVEDAPAGRGLATVVEGLQVLDGDRLALLVGHRLGGDCHGLPSARA